MNTEKGMAKQTASGAEPGIGPDMRPRFLDHVDAPIDRAEVLRYLGYPVDVVPNRELRELLEHWVAEAEGRAQPRAVFAGFPIAEIGKQSLCLKTTCGTTEFRGAIGEFLGKARQIVAFIATAGPNVELLASELMREGDHLEALIVSAVGSERAEAAEMAVIEQLRSQGGVTGLVPTLPYSPGYCGMALSEQTKLFELVGDHSVGVSLTVDCLMKPLKSVSGLIGLGLPEEVKQYGSPCDRCELKNCDMRRLSGK
jgi:hypothetical protein